MKKMYKLKKLANAKINVQYTRGGGGVKMQFFFMDFILNPPKK
jgi:hypothetical protein